MRTINRTMATELKPLILREGEYLPDVGTVYPTDDPLTRLVPTKQVKELTFDASYPFLDESFAFKIKRNVGYFIVADVALRLLNHVKFGLKVEGREVLRKYRKEFKGGMISVSNHCYNFDGVAIYHALRHRIWIPMLSDLITSSNGWLLRPFGGIPLPDGSLGAQKRFNEAFDTLHSKKAWIHIFAEARSWHYYKPLRPFQKGAFTMAYKYNVPILPISISYRERTGIYKLFGPKQIPLITVRLGEPIFPDTTQPRRAETDRLLKEAHARVCELGGIIQNPWPPVWEEK